MGMEEWGRNGKGKNRKGWGRKGKEMADRVRIEREGGRKG